MMVYCLMSPYNLFLGRNNGSAFLSSVAIDRMITFRTEKNAEHSLGNINYWHEKDIDIEQFEGGRIRIVITEND